ncbi:hypothetical protein M378DRAFT_160071 [Amanita muscaria Koide BX008]|uniref:Uncharacterized protein n=1 Tax=Amanita muscaria (strain Koide BX008) TaxID=946122 RepID=A0A0C2XE46_AMAMK|nr:hypothetical protein M378DRAFT_160071 [Amanita muscaria Koide BX008]
MFPNSQLFEVMIYYSYRCLRFDGYIRCHCHQCPNAISATTAHTTATVPLAPTAYAT